MNGKIDKLFKNKIINLVFFSASTFGVLIYLVINFCVIDGEMPEKRETWKTYIMIPLYYTFISNVLVMLASWQRMFPDRFLPRLTWLPNLSTVGILLTFVVYWGLLSGTLPEASPIKIVGSVFYHGVTPLIALFVYIWTVKNQETVKLPLIKSSFLFLSFPFGWLIIGLAIYFAFGHEKIDAFYGFIAILQNPWWETTAIWIGILVIFLGISFLINWIANRNAVKK